MAGWPSLANLGPLPREMTMPIVNRTPRHGAQTRRTPVPAFHPSAKFVGYIFVLAFAGLTLAVGIANHGLFR
jgi:hypothetical protein